MILSEEDGAQIPKLRNSHLAAGVPTVRLPERVAGRSSSLSIVLPDYETSEAQQKLFSQQNVQQQPKTSSRFWKATVYAMVIYVILSICVTVLLVKSLRGSGRHHPPPWADSSPPDGGPPPVRLVLNPPLIDPDACRPWSYPLKSGDLYTSSTSQTFDPTASITIRSNVSDDRSIPQQVLGNLTVDINPDKSITTSSISLNLSTSTLALQSSTYACLDTHGNVTLFIYTPSPVQSSDLVILDVTILYPQSTSPVRAAELATYLPVFDQKVGNITQSVTYKKVALDGPSSHFIVGSLQAHEIVVKGSYSPISGTFNASKALILDTVEAPINADIILYNTKRKSPPFLCLDTGNSAINAKVTLVGIPSPQLMPRSPLAYQAQARTFNGPLNVEIVHDPSTSPSSIHFSAVNNQAETNVTLDSSFEGTYSIQTKLASAIVDTGDLPSSTQLTEKEIQSGERRYYKFDTTTSERVFGWVGSGKRPGPWSDQGHIEILSSLSPIYLSVSGS